jgi:hypothetical protein
VTESEPTSIIPPGWYADHTGEPRMRWWDGSQWTDHVSDPTPRPYQLAPARNTVPSTTPVGNVFIWIIVLLPLVSIALSFTVDYAALGRAVVDSQGTASSLAIYSNPAYLLSSLFSYVLIAVTTLLAYFDWRRLKRTGFERPFFWVWGLLGIVYVIGRTVVVRRRSGRGIAPLLAYIGVLVASYIITGFEVSRMISVILQNLPGVPSVNS